MAAILPTKGNLMAAKRSRALATTGYELMDRKRNILVREMMTLMEDASRIQREIDQVFQSAYIALAKANIELGLCDRIAEGVEPDNPKTYNETFIISPENNTFVAFGVSLFPVERSVPHR